MFINTLIRFSAYQLPGLRSFGNTPEEIKQAKETKSSWCKLYCLLPERLDMTELSPYKEHIANLNLVRRDYNDPPKNFYYDQDYIDYINFIKKDLKRCHCGTTKCCSWCIKNDAMHNKNSCDDTKWEFIREKYSTWRKYFMDNETLSSHEWAIYSSYFDPLLQGMSGKACPCQEIYTDYHRNESKIIEYLKYYNSDKLKLHMELITKLNLNK